MLKISEVKELIKLIDDSTISNFLYEQDGVKVEIKKNVGEAVVAAPVVTKQSNKKKRKQQKRLRLKV